MVVVADAGMLSASNLNAIEDAGFSFIVGSWITKAPYDLAGHFTRHGDYFARPPMERTQPRRKPDTSRYVRNDCSRSSGAASRPNAT